VGKVAIIAHRGASAYAPENTLAAFRLAREQGADFFELDCMRCGSGEVVVIHDDTVERTTSGRGPVSGLSLIELRRLDAGSWFSSAHKSERIPTLEEALALADERCGCYIEMKQPTDQKSILAALDAAAGTRLRRDAALDAAVLAAVADSPGAALARDVVARVRALGRERVVVLQSYSLAACAVAALEAPELPVELLGEEKHAAAWEHYIRWVVLLGLRGLNTSVDCLREGRVKALAAARKTCGVYTVDDPAEMRRVAKLGIARMITNKPDVCAAVLR